MTIVRQVIAWLMVAGGLAGWPLAAFWIAEDEPPFVLGLSFLALVYAGFNALQLARGGESKARRIIAWAMLIGGLVGWPVAAFWLAKAEPQFVLGLSFMALIYEAFNALQISHDNDNDD